MAALLASTSAWAALILAILVATTILLRRSYGYFGRRSKQSGPIERVRPLTGRGDSGRDPPPEVARWEVEMHDLARELSARLDNKVRVLEQLVGEARAEVARLEQLLARSHEARPPATGDEAPAGSPARLVPTDPDSAEGRRTEIQALAAQGLSPASIAHRLGGKVADVESVLAGEPRTAVVRSDPYHPDD